MIFPISHEGDEVRRLPWISIIIMVLCFGIHIYISRNINNLEENLGKDFQEYYLFYTQHPYLTIDPELKKMLNLNEPNGQGQEGESEQANEETSDNETAVNEIQDLQEKYADILPPESVMEEEQIKLDEIALRIKNAIKHNIYMEYGYIPAKKKFTSLISSMFLHGGWIHLLGNLFMFYLCGPFIEDKWGKIVFALFYLSAGMFSASMYAFHYPQFNGPLIGASGAIAGVMGAFLVRFWYIRIRFAYWIFFFLRGTFFAPAWMMLPLWVVNEFVNAKATDIINPSGEGGGVAHWAHIWGFIFGVAIALIIKFLNFEKKFVEPVVAAKTTYVDPNYKANQDALALLEKGDEVGAFNIFMTAVKKDSTYQDNVEALWNLSIRINQVKDVYPYVLRLVDREVRNGSIDLAIFHYNNVKEHIPTANTSLQNKIKFAEALIEKGESKIAEKFLEEAIIEVNEFSPPGIINEICNIALKIDMTLERTYSSKIIPICLQHNEIPQERKNELKGLLATSAASFSPLSASLPQFNDSPPPVPKIETPTPVPSHIDTQQEAYSLKENEKDDIPSSSFTISQNSSNSLTSLPYEPSTESSSSLPFSFSFNDDVASPQPSFIPVPPVPMTPPSSSQEPTNTHSPSPSEYIIQSNSLSSPATPPTPPHSVQPHPIHPIEPPISNNPNIQKTFNITSAVPVDLKEGKLFLDVTNVGERSLSVDRIKFVSVAKITPQEEKPFLLLDFVLSDIASSQDLRVIRVSSSNFMPKKLVPDAPSVMDAFKIFIANVIRLSGAQPYPNAEAVLLKKIPVFTSIDRYEQSFSR